jgi:Bacillus haemolytic enterotoxin (HBL)
MPDTTGTQQEPTSTVLSPGDLAGASDTDPFVLSSADWVKVQVYVEQGAALPTTMDDMQVWLGQTITDDLKSDFNLLIDTHTQVKEHCSNWKTRVYPQTVDLANSIVHYNTEVPDLYQALLDTLDIIKSKMRSKDPGDKAALADAQADFHDLLADRSEKARDFAKQADDAAKAVSDFVTETEDDKTKIETVQKDFNDKYGAESDEVKSLQEQLTEEQTILDDADAEYRHDVVVASTTPTYSWIIPAGLIAGAVVAGVYGDRAVKALQRKRAAQDQINTIGGQITRDQNLMSIVGFGKTSISGLLDHLNAALPVLQKIKGIWNAIASDLDNLADLMTNDVEKAVPIVEKIEIKGAIKSWDALSQKADKYRVNAYVTVQGNATDAIQEAQGTH